MVDGDITTNDQSEGALFGAFRVEELRIGFTDIATRPGPMTFARLVRTLAAAGAGEARIGALIAGISSKQCICTASGHLIVPPTKPEAFRAHATYAAEVPQSLP